MIGSKGQTLLELVVSLGLGLIVVSALVITTTSGLKNSQFSQDQAKATELAQEGLESVRTIADRNCKVVIGGNTYYWYNKAPLIWDNLHQLVGGPNFGFSTSPDPAVCSLTEVSPPFELVDNRFRRHINLVRLGSDIRVTAVVTWSDFSGSHNSSLITILSRSTL